MEVNGAKQLLGSNRFSKYLLLCSLEEKLFHFWVEYPFKSERLKL